MKPDRYIVATLAIMLLGVGSIIMIFYTLPNTDLAAMVAALIGFLTPALAIVLLLLRDQHLVMNSHLEHLIKLERALGKAEGKAEEKIDAKARRDAE